MASVFSHVRYIKNLSGFRGDGWESEELCFSFFSSPGRSLLKIQALCQNQRAGWMWSMWRRVWHRRGTRTKDVVAFLRCRTSEPHLRVLFGESMNIYVKRNMFCFFTWMFACDFDSKKLLSLSTAGGEKIWKSQLNTSVILESWSRRFHNENGWTRPKFRHTEASEL